MTEIIEKAIEIEEQNRKRIEGVIDELYSNLNEKVKFDFKVTDHAILRYLQRIELIPISEARYKILNAVQTVFNNKNFNTDKIGMELRLGSIIYLIKNRTIITIKTLFKDDGTTI
jgi:hypothetical protein